MSKLFSALKEESSAQYTIHKTRNLLFVRHITCCMQLMLTTVDVTKLESLCMYRSKQQRQTINVSICTNLNMYL